MKSVVGKKVKVHGKTNSEYGEALGYTKQGKLVVHKRISFKDLKISEFDMFRNADEVEFIDFPIPAVEAYDIQHPGLLRHVPNRQRLLKNLLEKHKNAIKERSEEMDSGELRMTISIIQSLENKLKPN